MTADRALYFSALYRAVVRKLTLTYPGHIPERGAPYYSARPAVVCAHIPDIDGISPVSQVFGAFPQWTNRYG